MQVYNERDHVGQKAMHNFQFEEKKSISKGNTGDTPCAERDQEVKKRLALSGIKQGAALEEEYIYSLMISTCERKRFKAFFFFINQQQMKTTTNVTHCHQAPS